MNELDGILAPSFAAPAAPPAGAGLDEALAETTRLAIFNGYVTIFVVAFIATLVATPLMRRLALAHDVVDHPDERKTHRAPVAYLGGVAVFLGLLAAIGYSIFAPTGALPLIEAHQSQFVQSKTGLLVVLAGMTAIMLAGLLDDVVGVSPRLKIAGMLFAAAILAMQDFGVKVAAGVLSPLGKLVGNQNLTWSVHLPDFVPIGDGLLTIDVIYWAGTLIIALFILGACNASNLIDGLDGLLSGVTAIAAAGLLVIALGLAAADDGRLDTARITLCLALLGATMGFLPYNFSRASIFLGDAGSLLLGFVTIVIILSLGDTGKTALVVAGLIVFMLPILDTTLAIVRRKMAGQPMSEPDRAHLHHLLSRTLGVRGAVAVLYGIATLFAALGVLISLGRARVAYTFALVLASYIIVTAIKVAKRGAPAVAPAAPKRSAQQANEPSTHTGATPPTPPTPPTTPATKPHKPTPA